MEMEKLGTLGLLFKAGEGAAIAELNKQNLEPYYGWLEVLNQILRLQELAERSVAKIWAELTIEELQEKTETLGLTFTYEQLEALKSTLQRVLQAPLAYGSAPIPEEGGE